MQSAKNALSGISSVVLIFMLSSPALAQSGAAAPGRENSGTQEIVVTAQKRQENVQDVGMSVQTASGDKLTQLGITDPSQLTKIIPGFTLTSTDHGTPVYTIRGVGFQDNSLAGSPTVSIYLDEVPIPFSAMTLGASLDLQRVEVLKGPQGTLFGENATGGAINYIANKPSNQFQAGVDLSYGRFNTMDLSGFVGGPITDTLDFRIALRTLQSGDWQKSYGPLQGPEEIGKKNFYNGRVALQLKPTDNFKALLTASGWRDRSETQIPQIYGIAPHSSGALDPRIANYPLAPHNNQAANWSDCVNTSPFDPPFDANGHYNQNGPSAPWAPGTAPIQGTSCTSHRKNNTYYAVSLRMDFDLSNDMVLTSLTSHEQYDRYEPLEGAGVIYQDYQTIQTGSINTTAQELRLSSKFRGKGNWIIGGNYEHDDTADYFLQTYGGGTFGTVFGQRLGPNNVVNLQKTSTYAVFGNGDYPLTHTITLQGGIRYTQSNKSYAGCALNGLDGTTGQVFVAVINYLESQYTGPGAVNGQAVLTPPGACATSGPGPTFNPPSPGSLYTATLNQNNIAWRGGLNWKVKPDTLVYVNVSQGYKAGSFPTVGASSFRQLQPVVQEGLLAYEGGVKSQLFDRHLQIAAAAFYYQYENKQILGQILDPVFGSLTALVNVPKSHVEGFEVSAVWIPLAGLTMTPSVSYQNSGIDRCSPSISACSAVPASVSTNNPAIPGGVFHGFDAFGQLANLNGEAFPNAPRVTADIDAQYDWQLRNGVHAIVGVNANYTSKTYASFIDRAASSAVADNILDIPGHAIVDLRAGISKDNLDFQIWGRNILSTWYWTGVDHFADTLARYTGMPATYGFTLSYRYR